MPPTSANSNSREAARNRATARIRQAAAHRDSPETWAEAIATGDRDALSRAITLVESRSPADRPAAESLLLAVLRHVPVTESVRIGVTGIPGVGKSTFIERFGQHLIASGHRVAVLAVDPSSKRSRGSLLGDKTRMEQLVRCPEAFVRPSPAAEALGGVNRATSEAILLCEAAGFDRILVETVGVGQSETAVREMTDVFLLLLISGAGDDLQGIKRGIMEMADLVVVNKADGNGFLAAQQTARECATALHLLPPAPHGCPVEVLAASGLEGAGLGEVAKHVDELVAAWRQSGWWKGQRTTQLLDRFAQQVRDRVLDRAFEQPGARDLWERLQTQVLHRQISPYSAASIFVDNVDSSK
jgi:LAO/AO transport system kinase